MKQLLSLIAFFTTLALSLPAAAMPPRYGQPSPDYPAGVNAPSQAFLNRDDANLEGEWNCLVILIDFPDYRWDNQNDSNFANEGNPYTTRHFNEMLFSDRSFRHPGSASDYTGSMRDYYSEISGGDFTVSGVATRWYRAPESYSYYCNADGESGTPDDYGFGDYPTNAQGLVEAAVNAADNDVDFADYDNDGDGVVDAIFIVHAGPGAEEIPGDAGANYIWSHKWQIPGMEVDGVSISEYTIEPQGGTIGVFCHEFGHALGLPDLYDTDDSSEGVGEWCLMGSGGWCYRPGDPAGTSPTHMCAWSKMRLEWVDVTNVEEGEDEVTIPPVVGSGIVYRLAEGGELGPEYFLVENRRRAGFDAGLTRRQVEYNLDEPSGLLILHVDETAFTNEDDDHRLVDVVEASGLFGEAGYVENLDGNRGRPNDRDLLNANRGDDGDLWPGYTETDEARLNWTGDREKHYFDFSSIPPSNKNNGEPSFVSISNMFFEGENIVCDFSLDIPDQPVLVRGDVELSDAEDGNDNGAFEPGETVQMNVHLTNLGLRDAVRVSMTAQYHGELGLEIEPAGSVAYPDIPAGVSRAANTPFRLTLAADAPPTADILLACVATSNEGLEFPLMVHIPVRPPHEWNKLPDPALTGSDGAWDAAGMVGIASIIEDDTLKVWYIGGSEFGENPVMGAIGLAWSVDGGESFTKLENPVIGADMFPDWAANGFRGLGLLRLRNSYVMMLMGESEDNSMAIGKATSEDGVEWDVSGQPAFQPGGWVTGFFPIGSLTLYYDGQLFQCGFGGMNEQGMSGLGAAVSMDLNRWQLLPQPIVLPTFNEADFDGFLVFSPSINVLPEGIKLVYCGLGGDFQMRLGMMNVTDGPRFERYEGTETGGAILEADPDNWEAGGMILGGNVFNWNGENRLLYVVSGEASGAVGLAFQSVRLSAPPIETDPHHPMTIRLDDLFPNPFNGMTTVVFTLPVGSNATLALYDLSGRLALEKRLGFLSAGSHSALIDATSGEGSLASGYYYLKLQTAYGSVSRGALLLK